MKEVEDIMKTNKRKVFSSSIGLLALFLIGSAFSAPLSNSDTTTNSAVVTKKNAKPSISNVSKKTTKKAAKKDTKQNDNDAKQVVAQGAKTESASQNSGNYLSRIASISPSKIKTAAGNENQAAQLIQSQSGMSQVQSQKVAQELFTNSQYTSLRNDLSSGNWIGAYQQYQTLSNNGAISQLEQAAKN